jgi:hypothetical protein
MISPFSANLRGRERGIQYSPPPVKISDALEYWMARFRGR